jgi:class 3 adenylate cyclase
MRGSLAAVRNPAAKNTSRTVVSSDIYPSSQLLKSLAAEAQQFASDLSPAGIETLTVAFFDLTGSTRAKLENGGYSSVKESIAFIRLVQSVSTHFGGVLVKSLGDGALVTFRDPVAGCKAALSLRWAVHSELQLKMTAGLTCGRPLIVSVAGREDILGDVVDRAARIQSAALPGQVLIDDQLWGQARTYLIEQTDLVYDHRPRKVFAKGIGTIDLIEISFHNEWQLRKELATPFRIDADGRPALSEKLEMIENASHEIIEIGIGLTSFAQYFTGQQPDEFRDPIRALVRKGVSLKCYALDPGFQAGVDWVEAQGNANYMKEANIAAQRLLDESKFCDDNNFSGQLQFFRYGVIPEFWCLGVDLAEPNGRMFFAAYLPGVNRAEMPHFQVSMEANKSLYNKLIIAVNHIRSRAVRVTRLHSA